MPTRAVLLDFNGLLADTENVHVAAWQRTLRVLGWAEPEESCLRALEVDDEAFLREVFARRKVEAGDLPGWVGRKRALTVELLRDRPRLQPGAAELVQALREAGVALGVVTTARRANVETVLAATGLLDAFDVVVAGDDVAHPKPDPEPYRRALDRLGIDPADAVALEDSSTGLASARGAGLRAVAVAPTRPAADEAGPDAAVAWLPGLDDLPAVLAALGV